MFCLRQEKKRRKEEKKRRREEEKKRRREEEKKRRREEEKKRRAHAIATIRQGETRGRNVRSSNRPEN
jgi:hypothetical protein